MNEVDYKEIAEIKSYNLNKTIFVVLSEGQYLYLTNDDSFDMMDVVHIEKPPFT